MSEKMTFELRVEKCPSCGKPMMDKCKYGIFPFYTGNNQEAQMKEKGVVFRSTATMGNDPICVECKDADKASFKCALCKEMKPSSKEEESFGDPAEYLCKDCYATVPAKVWDDKAEKLRHDHQYDWE